MRANPKSTNTKNIIEPEIILIYNNYKGVGQVIRLLLAYIQVPFADIYLDQYEIQKPTLSEKVKQTLQANPVHPADLPTIIHDGLVISQLNQIMTYICRAFDREDLLGVGLQQKTQVCEIMQIYSKRILPSIRFLTIFVNEAFSKPLEGNEMLSFIEEKYLKFLEESGYIEELAIYLLKQEDPKFIFETITIVDFYFVEGARHTISLFGSIDAQSASSRWTETAQNYLAFKQGQGEVIKKVEILRAIKTYIEYFSSQEFYKTNQAYFQGFKVFPKQVPETILMGMKKLWAIDEKHLHY